MLSLNEYNKIINLIKQKHRKIITNIFLDNNALLEILNNQKTNIAYNDDYFIIFQAEQNFKRIYFAFGYEIDFPEILKNIILTTDNKDNYIFELVDRDKNIDKVSAIFEKSIFVKFAELKRLRTNKILLINFNNNDVKNDVEFKIADESMVNVILELLYNTFNAYVSHLPNREQLKNLIKSKLVFIAVKNNTIAGVICLENIGKNGKYLYQIMVDEKFRGQGISKKLASYAFEKYKNDSLFISWVESNNASSIALHHELGFKEDGLITVVFKNKE